MNYNETLNFLYNRLPTFHLIGGDAYKPGLERTLLLMEKLDNPHQHFPTIHIAGTNGKGSVSHFLSAILQLAGYKVGLYTSPHLVDFGERVKINGKMIEQQYVIDFVKEYEWLFNEVQPSFFEATMALGFKYFYDNKVDISVVEVGLGGRLDSTNIISPKLSVITNIGLDHTQFLGNNLASIAREKAGIIKQSIPVVIGEKHQETTPVFEKETEEKNAKLIFAENENLGEVSIKNRRVIVKIGDREVLSELQGLYQIKNLKTVLSSVEQLRLNGFEISDKNILDGIEKVVEISKIKGRWQTIKIDPRVIADTGHNREGIEEIVNQLKTEQYDHLHIVFGMVDDKDIDGVFKLLPKNANYYLCQANTHRAVTNKTLLKLANDSGLNAKTYDSVAIALSSALENATNNDLVFVGGSNYVVGDAMLSTI